MPPRKGALATIPIGPYSFSFSNIHDFAGLFSEIFLNETYYIPKTTTSPVVIDAGANIGVSLLYIKLQAPGAVVTCFEPNPSARRVLEENIRHNSWQTSVSVVPAALGATTGTTTLFVSERADTSSDASVANYLKEKGRKLNSFEVPVEVLSKYVAENTDLLKLDIEGPEFDVLRELKQSGALSRIKAIQMEYHYIPNHFETPLGELLQFLTQAGFTSFVESIAKPHTIVGKNTSHAYMVFAWRL
jgi:FkbM family methyltransferase